MLFEITASARSDYTGLTERERLLFRQSVSLFNSAADRYAVSGDNSVWPGRLRVRSVVHARGVYEMTWSFSDPDGRATWEWISVSDTDGTRKAAVRWRRIGKHDVFVNP